MRFLITTFPIFLFSLVSSVAQVPSWVWAKSFGNSNSDVANFICTDKTGNIYSVGYFNSDSIIFGNETLFNEGDLDMFITKYDNNGSVLWAKSAGMYGYDEAYGVTTDLANNVYVVGAFYDSLITFDSITLINSYDSTGYSDMFIVKYDSMGNVIWAISNGGRYEDLAFSVNADAHGNIYISGFFNSDTLFIGSTILINTDSIFTDLCFCDYDYFVAKYDSSGNFLWAKRGGAVAVVTRYPSAVDKFDNIYIAGSFNYSSMTIDSITLLNSSPNTTTDVFMVKYDSAGNFMWVRRSAGSDNEIVNAMTADPVGNIYLAGEIGILNTQFGSITLTNGGGKDAFLVKYDMNGNVLWAQNFGDNYNDVAYSVCVDLAGNIFITGYFGSPSVTLGSFILQNPGLFIAKLDSSGNVLWALEPTGGIARDESATDASGNLYIAGSFYDQSVNFNPYILTNNGVFEDIYIAKLGTSLGFNEVSSENQVAVFPNPTIKSFTIMVPRFTKMVQIFNLLGQLIQTKTNEGETNLIFSLEESGIYFIKITTETQTISKKVVVFK